MNTTKIITPLYKDGETVRIMDISELKAQFGKNIKVPSAWIQDMDEYAGKECTIVDAYLFKHTTRYRIAEDGGRYYWDECVFEPIDTIDIAQIELKVTIEDII